MVLIFQTEVSDEVAIENFKSEERFDVLICWGSINFGYWDLIQKQGKICRTYEMGLSNLFSD